MLRIMCLTILILLIFLLNLNFTHAETLMLGYSNQTFLPFLDNSSLDFQLGEELWVKAIGDNMRLILRSPSGIKEVYVINADKPILLKKFGNKSDKGIWYLESANNRSMKLIVRDPDALSPVIRYGLAGSNFLVQINGPPSVILINAEGLGRHLLIAGETNRLELNVSSFAKEYGGSGFPSMVMIDALSENSIVYRGLLEGSTYKVNIEPLGAKVAAEVHMGSLYFNLPSLHEVGAGGFIPIRPGEASLRIWLNETHSIIVPAYILDSRFNQFAGALVDRIARIPLNDLNRSLEVLTFSEERVDVIKLTPPVALIRPLDPHGNLLTNVSIVAENPTIVINGTAYILLRRSESIPPSQSRHLNTLIKVYVNGFEADSLLMNLENSKAYNITLNLKRLTLEVEYPSNKLLEGLRLTINGTSFAHDDGKCSYLLPPGEYVIIAKAGEYEGSAKMNLLNDSTIKLKLRRIMQLEDVLKITAAAELLSILVLLYVNYRGGVTS